MGTKEIPTRSSPKVKLAADIQTRQLVNEIQRETGIVQWRIVRDAIMSYAAKLRRSRGRAA